MRIGFSHKGQEIQEVGRQTVTRRFVPATHQDPNMVKCAHHLIGHNAISCQEDGEELAKERK